MRQKKTQRRAVGSGFIPFQDSLEALLKPSVSELGTYAGKKVKKWLGNGAGVPKPSKKKLSRLNA